jgi:cysteinyl-tRNA synthetase
VWDGGPPPMAPASLKSPGAAEEATQNFFEAMDDDINTPRALAELFTLSRAVNRVLEGSPGPDERAEARLLGAKLLELGRILGLFWRRPEKSEAWPEEFTQLAEARIAARKSRDFKRADELRDQLKAQGVAVEDTPDGYRLKKL